MKKGIILTMCCLLGSVLFAQEYSYADADYAAAADRVARVRAVGAFPQGFFHEDGSFSSADDAALFALTKKTYEQHPYSFQAAMNYVAALLCTQHPDVSPSTEHLTAAHKVLMGVIKINPNSLEVYRKLDDVLNWLLLDGDGYYGDRLTDSARLDYYNAHPEWTQDNFMAFEQRVRLGDENLSSRNYRLGYLMGVAVKQPVKAAQYLTKAEELEREEQTVYQAEQTQVFKSEFQKLKNSLLR